MAWWREEYERVLHAAAATSVAGLAMGIWRGLIKHRYGGWLQWLATLVGTVFVAVMAGFVVADADLPLGWSFAVVGLCAFLADDILLGVGAIASMFRADPLGLFARVVDAIRGRKGDK